MYRRFTFNFFGNLFWYVVGCLSIKQEANKPKHKLNTASKAESSKYTYIYIRLSTTQHIRLSHVLINIYKIRCGSTNDGIDRNSKVQNRCRYFCIERAHIFHKFYQISSRQLILASVYLSDVLCVWRCLCVCAAFTASHPVFFLRSFVIHSTSIHQILLMLEYLWYDAVMFFVQIVDFDTMNTNMERKKSAHTDAHTPNPYDE